MVAADTTPIRDRIRRAEAFLDQVGEVAPPLLDDDAALRGEARRLRSLVEMVAGRPYGRLPHVAYRGRLETRLMGPWSQYLTLGIGLSRVVRMTSWETSRPAIPTVLAHELSHRFGFDESLTTLRGLEVSARLAEQGDSMHQVSARLELARLLLGAAMGDALRAGAGEEIDAFFEAHADRPAMARPCQQWRRVKGRRLPDWSLTVYAEIPCASIEAARAGELQRSSLAAARAADVLGWRPETGLSDGLRVTYESVRLGRANPAARAPGARDVRVAAGA